MRTLADCLPEKIERLSAQFEGTAPVLAWHPCWRGTRAGVAPVLAWHREAADDWFGPRGFGSEQQREALAATFARHDPAAQHAETVRLLKEANEQIAAMRAVTTIDLERWRQLESLVELIDDEPTGFFISCEDFPDEPDVWVCFTKFLDARIRTHLATLSKPAALAQAKKGTL